MNEPRRLLMAWRYTLDIYEKLILSRLADGPKSLVQLEVPRYAMQTLQREGPVYMRTHKVQTTTAK